MSSATRRRALVTGGTGFIGSHLVRRLVTDGWEVHVLVRPAGSRSPREDGKAAAVLVSGDITDPASVDAAVRQTTPDVIFHLASRTDLRMNGGGLPALDSSIAVNLAGTLNVIRAAEAHGVRRMLRAGGLEEYGTGPTPSHEAQREAPVSPYSASQVAATHYCQMLQRHLTCHLVTLRPALVYGPGQSTDFFIPSLIEACLAGRDFTLAAGHHGRDLLYVDDLVEAFVRASTAPGMAGAVLNVGSGQEYVIREVAELIIRLTGARIRFVPGITRPRYVDLEHLAGRNDLVRQTLGWEPLVPLEEGLLRTITWYRSQRETSASMPAEHP